MMAITSDKKRDDDSRGATNSTPEQWMGRLAVTAWISGGIFGLFAGLHYLRAYADGTALQWWDATDNNLYRQDHPKANRIMALHMFGGVVLMVLGPIQLWKYIRSHFMWLHRWIGRLYIAAAVLASTCAIVWVLVWRTSRCNIHEDLGNLIFGLAVLVCALQTYWHVAPWRRRQNEDPVTRDRRIQQHQLWAWRLYACVFGAPQYRLFLAIYGGILVAYASFVGKPVKQELWLENALFYVIVIPNLIVVQLLWQRKQRIEGGKDEPTSNPSEESALLVPNTTQQEAKETPPSVVSKRWVIIVIWFLAISTTINSALNWIPAMQRKLPPDFSGDLYHDFCNLREERTASEKVWSFR